MFHNKSILITGASSGLGQSLAVELYAKGANLTLIARDEKSLEKTKILCTRQNPHSKPPLLFVGDICKQEDCQKMVAETIQSFGQLDYLILNAGISMWARFDFLKNTNIIRQLIETNYLAAVQCIFHALPYLKLNRGMIVAISSVQGKFGTAYYSGYSASKHALEGFLDALHMELNNTIDILTVCPTWINGTNLKKNAFGDKISQAKIIEKHKSQGISLQYCVEKIIAAMQKRKRELVLPPKYYAVPWLKLICPKFLNKLALRYLE